MLDWRSFDNGGFSIDEENPYQFVDNALRKSVDYLHLFDLGGFLPVVDWLKERRDEVSCDRPAPIHFDFHPANILLQPDGTAVVLDWSGFDISDARFDLAWTMVLVSSYEGVIWRNRILQTYERLLGAPVKQITFFEVFACVRRLFSVIVSLQGGAEKLGMDPNAVTLIKEQMDAHQRVYDRLVEITGVRLAEVEGMFASFS